ncbi:hypothetical protein DL770_008963 [Monosporascus sp. CRB-9-2]|nr:hypothetical protein DL770_008963 [Monosporascus sp. CRB-9-2]
MSNSDSPGPLLTFESLLNVLQPASTVLLTPAAKRLFWSLQGPLATGIFVMADGRDPNSPARSLISATIAGTSWHPISQEALTEPKVSSVTVRVKPLEI